MRALPLVKASLEIVLCGIVAATQRNEATKQRSATTHILIEKSVYE